MGVNMNFLMNLIQLGLDVGILALCCEAVFRQKSEIKAKDFFIFPILLVLCVVPRVDFSVGANMTASLRSEGFEILPADNIVGLLYNGVCHLLSRFNRALPLNGIVLHASRHNSKAHHQRDKGQESHAPVHDE